MLTQLKHSALLLCSICRKTFVNKKDLDDHCLYHGHFSKPSLKHFRSHFKEEQEEKPNNIVDKRAKTLPKEALFMCNHCWKQCKGIEELQHHLKQHITKENNVHSVKKIKDQTSDQSLFMCGVCNTLYNSNDELECHFKIHLSTDNENSNQREKDPVQESKVPIVDEEKDVLAYTGVSTENPTILYIKQEPQDPLYQHLFQGTAFTGQEQFNVLFTGNGDLQGHEKLPDYSMNDAYTNIKIESDTYDSEKSLFMCRLCQPGIIFTSTEELQSHMNSHKHDENPTKTLIKKELDISQSENFYALYDSEPNSYCSDQYESSFMHIEDRTSSSETTNSAVAINLPDASFECEPCGTYYSSEEELQDHMKVHALHTDPLLLEVKSMKSGFEDFSHESTDQPDCEMGDTSSEVAVFMCEPCGALFTNNKELQEHFLVHEKESRQNSEDFEDENEARAGRKEEPVFMCDPCNVFFTDNEEFLAHLKIHSCDDDASSAIIEKLQKKTFDKTTSEEPIFMCALCSSFFPTNYELQVHFATHITSDNEVKIQCTNEHNDYVSAGCDKNLARHSRFQKSCAQSHTCSVCSAGFSSFSLLSRHMKDQHANKPFVCTVCTRSFSRKHLLQKHLNAHARKPFMCTSCKKTFDSLEAHLKHMKTAHPSCQLGSNKIEKRKSTISKVIKIHMCNICTEVFPFKSALNTHLQETHKLPLVT